MGIVWHYQFWFMHCDFLPLCTFIRWGLHYKQYRYFWFSLSLVPFPSLALFLSFVFVANMYIYISHVVVCRNENNQNHSIGWYFWSENVFLFSYLLFFFLCWKLWNIYLFFDSSFFCGCLIYLFFALYFY